MRKILKFYFFVGNVAKACSSFAKTAPVHLAGAQQVNFVGSGQQEKVDE